MLPFNWLNIVLLVIIAFVGYLIAPAHNPVATFIAGLLIGSVVYGLTSKNRSQASENEERLDVQSIYVGNLSFKARPNELRAHFAQHGKVNSVRLMTDKQTGRSRGFGFVEMPEGDAKVAIKNLNGSEFKGREITVSPANDKKQASQAA